MSNVWRLWLIYGVSVAVLLGALGFVTHSVVELHQERARSAAEAEQEKLIQIALWRLDSTAAPILARENARPYREYRSTYPLENVPGLSTPSADPLPAGSLLISNLLQPEPAEVMLHFQINPDGELTSPQVPQAEQDQLYEAGHTDAATVREYQTRLNRLSLKMDYAQVAALLPSASLLDARALFEWGSTAASINQPAGQTASDGKVDYDWQARVHYNANQYDLNNAQRSQPQQVLKNMEEKAESAANQFKTKNETTEGTQDIAYAQPEADLFTERADRVVPLISEGLMRPIWLDEQLILARRVTTQQGEVVQGVWLDWDVVKRRLLEQVGDLLPGAALEPIFDDAGLSEADLSRRMATLPVRLVVDELVVGAGAINGPTRYLLISVWLAVLIAVVAVGLLLRGAVVLSERRGAFVSAVTHELRTPLTTFRMYAEMLAGGMVTDEQKRQRYLNTLTSEAGRLSHLVENVLAYARLERGKPSRRVERVSVAELVHRVTDRLPGRCEQASFEIVVNVPDSLAEQMIETDTSAVEQIFYNLADNACKYAATAADRRLHIEADQTGKMLRLRVRDHGPGIEAREAKRLFKPFMKSAHQAAESAPGVGLGLAISRRIARSLRGELKIETDIREGACFELTLPM